MYILTIVVVSKVVRFSNFVAFRSCTLYLWAARSCMVIEEEFRRFSFDLSNSLGKHETQSPRIELITVWSSVKQLLDRLYAVMEPN